MKTRALPMLGTCVFITSMSQTLNAGHWEGGRAAEANYMDLVPAQRTLCSPSTEGSPGEQRAMEFKIWSESADKEIPLGSDVPSSVRATIDERIQDYRKFIIEDRLDSFRAPFGDAVADIKAHKLPDYKEAKKTYDAFSDSVKSTKEAIVKLEEGKISLEELEDLRELYLIKPNDKGVGYEIKKVPGGLVEIWVLWPDKSGASKRAQATPILTIEENSIDPKFYTSLEEKKFNSINSFTGKEVEYTANELNVEIAKLGEGHFSITDTGLGSNNNDLNIRKLVHFMDLGCYQRVIRKYHSTQK